MKNSDKLQFQGKFNIEYQYGDEIINLTAENAVVREGLNNLLNSHFGDSASPTGWALGIISGNDASVSITDTHASHPGWTEFPWYVETTRPIWSPATAVSQSTANTNVINFTLTRGGFINGFFLAGGSVDGGATSANLKNSTNSTPVLWSTALLDSALTVKSGGVFKISYSLSVS